MGNRIINICVFAIAALFGGIVAAVCWIIWTEPKSVDFLSFWAAAKMVLSGAGVQIYDIEAHRAVERAAVEGGLLPFPYPPPFALLVAPFGVLPYGAAFSAWVVTTGAMYLVAARAWMPGRLALAQPSVLINGFIGQNAFLTSALFMGGARLLSSRPFLGGALLGGLVIKPQLALMLPVAVIAGGYWRAILGGVLSATALLAIGLLALGAASYVAFFEMLATYAGFVAQSRWPWHELASIYALMRGLSAPAEVALAVHGIIAAAAVGLVWQCWRKDWDGKVAVLACATLLVPPYLLTYDGLLLGLPIAWLLIEGRRPRLAALVWALSLMPVGSVFGFYDLPNTLPIAAVVSLLAIAWPQWRIRPSVRLNAASSAAR